MGETARCGIILACIYTAQEKTKSSCFVCEYSAICCSIILYLKDDTQGCVCVVCDSVKQTLSTVLDICCMIW